MRIWEDKTATYIPVTIQFADKQELENFIYAMKFCLDISTKSDAVKLCRTILDLINKL